MGRRNILELDSDGATGPLAARAASTVRGWNEMALTVMGSAPQLHALALLHTCMYNAWAAYDGTARQTVRGVAVRLPRAERDAASKTAAMSHGARRVLVTLFPQGRRDVDVRMAGLGLDPADAASQFSPAGIGLAQAAAVLDAEDQQPFARVPGAAEASRIAAIGDSPGPRRLANAACRGSDAAFVPPATYWCRLARHVSVRDGHDDDRDVLLFFVLAHALADAAIAAPGDGAVHAAAAEALRRFTGGDRLDAALGPATFTAAAEQAQLAHGTANACDDAQALGRRVGARVFDKARRYWQGKL
jgi:hypothetical protein